MSNRHHEKFIARLTAGIILVTAGIILIIYTLTGHTQKVDWYFWAIGIAVIINVGLVILGNAYVHKVKSDLIRKQRQKENHREPEAGS